MIRRLFLGIALFFVLLCHGNGAGTEGEEAVLFFFWGSGCPRCEEAKLFVGDLQRRYPDLSVQSVDVMASRQNLDLWIRTAQEHDSPPEGVPAFYVNGKAFSGFDAAIAEAIEGEVERLVLPDSKPDRPQKDETMTAPVVGEIDPASVSLPLFTLVIAGLDSFNPCAFFVLLSLLGILVHAGSRKRMLLVGGVFVFVSGLLYFLFMAAWLNLFLLAGNLPLITAIAGITALVMGGINAKDYFLFKKGVTLSISDEAKPKLFSRMRSLLHAATLPPLLAGTIVLSVAANSYELLCTAGFPMIYTRVLTLKKLPPSGYYLYLALYNAVYVIPLAVIVVAFSLTLSSKKLSERGGRVLKLLSGTMMLLLGATLLLSPPLLHNPLWAAALLAASSIVTGLTAWRKRR